MRTKPHQSLFHCRNYFVLYDSPPSITIEKFIQSREDERIAFPGHGIELFSKRFHADIKRDGSKHKFFYGIGTF
jgi:hypothetical protein